MASGRGRGGSADQELETVLAVVVLGLAGLGLLSALWGPGAREPAAFLEYLQPEAASSRLAALAGQLLGLGLALGSLLLVLLAAWLGLRAIWTVHTLRSRVAYALLPPPDFDPAPEQVEVFAQKLLGARRRVLRWLDAPASAIRIQLANTSDGRCLYLLELPRRFRGALYGAVAAAYPGVELRPAADLLAPSSKGLRTREIRLELRPARSDAWPLRQIKDWDPKRGFLPAFEQVQVAGGERLTMCVDLEPVAPRQLVPLRQRLLAAVRRKEVRYPLQTIDERSDWVLPAETIERQVERSGLLFKLGRSDPFFRVQILVRAQSPDKEHAKELVERTFAAWEQFAGANYVRSVGLPVLGTWFWGSNALWRRPCFDLRLATGLFAPPGKARLLVTRELTGFLTPWTRHCPAPAAARREAAELQPPEAARSQGMVVCETVAGRPVALAPVDARYHTLCLGPIGSGKSTLLANMSLDRIQAGFATVVIDPSKGDLVRDLLRRIPYQHWDRVRLIDPSLGRERPVGLNVLECPDPELHEVVADQVTFIFRRLFERWWGPRTDHVLRAAVLTLLRHPGTTVCDLPALLLNDDARRRWTTGLGDPLGLELFWQDYERLTPSDRQAQVGPLLYKLQTVLMRPSVRNILGQIESSIDLGQVLDQRGILLVSLPRGELGPETSSLLGSLLLARLWQVVQGRSRRPEAERPDACLVIDEFHRLLHLPQTLEEVAIEARSYHLGLVLAHQHLEQLAGSGLAAALGANVHTKVAFRCEHDAGQLASWFAPLSAQQLAGLDRYQVGVRLCVGGHSQPPFIGRTRPPAPDLGREHAEALTQAALERWGRSRAEVEDEILARFRARGAEGELEEWA